MAGLSRAVLTLYFLSVAFLAAAQDTAVTPVANEDAKTRPVEEITVLGKRTMTSVRFQLKRAEDIMFELFNDLNSSDEFDIDCKNTRYTRSHISKRTCEPKFLTRRRQENARFTLTALRDEPDGIYAIGKYLEDERESRARLSGKYQALGEEMLVIASEHPEYLKALLGVNTLKTELTALKEERFGN